MKVTKFFMTLFAVAATMSLNSCFSSDDAAEPETGGLISTEEVEKEVEKYGSVTLPVTDASNANASVVIPASALETASGIEDAKWGVAVRESESDVVVGDETVNITSYSVEIYPKTAQFEEEITISIPVKDEDGTEYEVVDVTRDLSKGDIIKVVNHCLTFTVKDFSKKYTFKKVEKPGHSGGFGAN